jgi:outer membrane protein OmpA-like peptidoglycan-associated protein
MKFRLALLSATVLAAPFAFIHAASAQPVKGPYVSGEAGYDIISAYKAKNLYAGNVNIPGKAKIVPKNGFTGQASFGYGFGDGFRVELEGDYIGNNFGKAVYNGAQFSSGGHTARYGAFLNGLYDFDIGLPYLYPYVGAGVGWQEASFMNFDPAGSYFHKTKSSFAFQGIAGVSYPIAYVPGLSATLEYRFVGLTGARKYNGSVGALPAQFKVQHEYDNQILVGVRYQIFNPPPPAPAPAPAPAPVAAPAPAPAKTYLVFFDWDKATLTPRATQIIAQAASDSKSQSTTTIDVSGYTDTSGTAVYNQGLSVRRAKAVAAQLVADGVPASEITAQGFGDTHLLVPTGPGVREPQNRRVEIVLH